MSRFWIILRAAIWRDVQNLKRAVLLLLRAVKSMHTGSDSPSETPPLEQPEVFPSSGTKPSGARRNDKRKAKKISRKLARSSSEVSQGGESTPISNEGSPRFHADRSSRTSSPRSSSPSDPDDEKTQVAQEFQTVQEHEGLEMGKHEVRIVMRSPHLPKQCIVLHVRFALESELEHKNEVEHLLN